MLTVIGILEQLAAAEPQRVCYTQLESLQEEDARDLRRAELVAAARAMAGALLEQAEPGDRVLLLLPSGLEFVVCFWACLYAGLIAVPLYPPKPNDASGKLANIISDCLPSLAIVPDQLPSELVEALRSGRLRPVRYSELRPVELPRALPAIGLEDLAFLQYSSGSTGDPKGVMIGHRNMLANLRIVEAETGCNERDVFVTWLPLFHDMGMVMGVLMPMVVGARSLLFSALKFAKNPLFWLQVLHHYRATFTGAPNFAYAACARRLSPQALAGLDLSALRIALNGAEPVRPETLEAFLATCAGTGLRDQALMPAYGMAEATVFLCAKSYQRERKTLALDGEALQRGRAVGAAADSADQQRSVGCGTPPSEHELIVVADGKALPDGQVGEIWVRGPSIARGYWNRPELSEQTFAARTAEGDGPYLRTGDLGFLCETELFVLGRVKDLLIVQGRNLYPSDLEAVASAALPVDAAGDGVAIGIEADGTETVALLLEARPRFLRMPWEEAAARIRAAVFEGHGVVVRDLLFLPMGGVDKTTSGKPMRSRMRQRLLDGELRPLYRSTLAADTEIGPALHTDTERRLAALWSRVLGVAIDQGGANFFAHGGDSLSLTRLVAAMRDEWGVAVPLRTLFEAPDLTGMAARLDAALQDPVRDADPAAFARKGGGDAGRRLPLSSGQQRLWFIEQVDDGSEAMYVITTAQRLRGRLDLEALRTALHGLVARHAALRTRVVLDGNGEPVGELVDAESAVPSLQIEDLRGLAAAQAEAGLQDLLAREVRSPFDLSRQLLLRALLVQLPGDIHVLALSVHHAASDGWSMTVLLREWAQLYDAALQGRASPLPELPLTWSDFVRWQQAPAQQARARADLAYWSEHLAGLPPVHGLALDAPRPARQAVQAGSVERRMPALLLERLRTRCRAQGATLFMGLHAAFAALLARFAQQTDIVVGTPIAQRESAELAGLVGFFSNTLVLRTQLSGDPGFDELLARCRVVALDAQAHQGVSFEALVQALQPERSLAITPLFQVMLVLRNALPPVVPPMGLELLSTQVVEGAAKFDLTLIVSEDAQGLDLRWEYAARLFERASIERLADGLQHLLADLLEQPERPLSRCRVMADDAAMAWRQRLHGPVVPYPHEQGLHEGFELQVERHPERIALTVNGLSTSYAALDAEANRMAHWLRGRGVGPDVCVGVLLERGSLLMPALLGILKAGGAYVPLEPGYPEGRLRTLIEDSGVRLVLGSVAICERHAGLCTAWPDVAIAALDSEAMVRTLAAQSAERPKRLPGQCSDNLAYLIYTSGSTGRPKGVMSEHRGAVNRLCWGQDRYRLGHDDVVLQKTPFSFDVSVWELFWPLNYGARLVLAAPEGHKDPAYIVSLIRSERVTIVHFVPSMLRVMLDGDNGWSRCTTVRQVFCSGEALASDIVERHHAEHVAVLHNLYGPTEASIEVSHWTAVRDAVPPLVPIGHAIQNTLLYVLDTHGVLQPPGVTGELHLGGDCLARGYLGRPELSAERFIANPFYDPADPVSRPRLYRTGDLARYRSDGTVEYLGRIDDQVKVRGFRIELGEIEAALQQQGVGAAVVVAREDEPGDRRLVAYLTQAEALDTEAWIAALKAQLQAQLPEYMVPSAFVLLDRIPLNSNGKVDRGALPRPALGAPRQAHVPPATPTERLLASAWTELLQLPPERVGSQDNFFALGGHSLLVIRLLARLQRAGLQASVQQVFSAPTLGALAASLDLSAGEVHCDAVELRNFGTGVPPGCTRVLPQMLPLAGLDAAGIERLLAHVEGGVANLQDAYPLAPLQEGILFHRLMQRGHDPYILPVWLSLQGRARVDAFLHALQLTIDRHEVLRTAFHEADGGHALQVVYRRASLQVEDFELDTGVDIEVQLRARMDAPQWMDLRRPPLLRVELARDPASDEWHALLRLHHLITDHMGLEVVQAEIVAQMLGQGTELAAPVPFKPFVARAIEAAARDELPAFFKARLADVVEPTAPFGALDVHGDGRGLGVLVCRVDGDAALRWRACARRRSLSPATLFHAAWALVVAACSAREDVVFGTVMSGRLQGGAGVEQAPGLLMNILPLRVDTAQGSVLDLVRRVDAGLREILPFEQAPLTLVQRCSGLPAGTPLFSAMLNYRHSARTARGGDADLAAAGLNLRAVRERTNYPFAASIDDEANGFVIELQVPAGVVPGPIADALRVALDVIADGLDAEQSPPLRGLPVLAVPERQRLLQALRGEAVAVDLDERVHERFEAQAVRVPQRVAVQCEEQVLSYGELNRRANQLAHLLRGLGVGPDRLVGLCMQRSVEMVVGVLAVLKAGGAYVPLDPSYPQERLTYMAEHARLDLVLTQQALQERVSAWLPESAEVLALDGLGQRLEGLSQDNPARPAGAQAQDLAYVIYTSGSTGRPKGVMNEHRGLLNRIDWMQRTYELDESDVVLQKTPFSFDVSVWELTWAFTVGARLVMAKPEGHKDPEYLARLIGERGVSVLHFVPSMLQAMLASGVWSECSSVKQVFCSGEALPVEAVRRHHALHAAALHNLYGPTEAAIDVTAWSCPRDEALEVVPIGRPIQNIELQVLDGYGRLVPQGVAGELHIGGVGLARGYLHREDLTAERFIANPHHDGQDPHSSARLYRTGDLARLRADGTVEYLGRIDEQVKIRGFRIELGEIEAGLAEHPGVAQAVVMAREDVPGEKQLVGYVSLLEGALVTAQELKQALQRQLPEYMVPAHVVVLDELPLNPSGKADRRALPAPERLRDAVYEAPSSATERLLASIWAELLQLDAQSIGAQANFFELGGHSLTAVRLMSLLRQRLDVELGLREVFDARSLRDLANDVERAQGQAQRPRVTRRQGTDEEALPLSYAQTRLWFLDCYDGGSTHYHLPMALRLRGSFEADLAEQALRRVLDRQEALRTVFDGQAEAPRQRLRSAQGFALDRVDLGGLEREAREIRVQALALAHAQAPFDLRSDLLLRASYVKLAQDEGVLLINMHHIASDGWSVGLLVDEFATQYNALRSGRQDNPLAPLAVRYADYAQWQREWLDQDGALEKQLAYWERQLAGLPPVHALALDHARPAQQSFEGATQSFMVDAATTQRLRELGRRTHCTLFMVLHAGLSVLLARHASASDIVIGTPVANRLHKELEDVVGFFANTLVLRTDTSGNPSFEQLLAQVREVNLQAQAHQDVPFEMLVERLNPARSAQYGPLVQIVLNLEAGASAATEAGIALPGLRVTTLGRAVVSAKFELQFNVEEVQGGLALGIDYNCALFEVQTIERMAQHWQRLLHSIAADATLGIHDLPMLAQGESTELLHRLNVRRAVHVVEQGLHERFEAQVRQAPRAIAAEYEGESLSYAELDAQANRLARHLREQGVGVDSLVGLSVERGLPMLVGLLAILKAGGAYVPLDPAYPAGRLAYMVGDSGMKLVLSQSSLRDKLGEITAQTAGIQLLELDDAQLQQQLQRYSAEALERLPGQGPGNLAYIIYTSGSTGQPKGVQIEHANVVRLFESAKRHFAFDASDVWTMFHSYGFDFSVWEIWGALLHGGRLVIVPQAVARSAPEFYELLQQRGVTILNQTPSAFAALVAVDELQPPNPPAALALRQVIFGGEALNLTALRPWMQRHGDASPELVNMYGITETTVHVTYRRIVQADVWAQSPPSVIGEVLDDLSALVLTPQGGLCPLGVAGELYVGGAGLARGYLNRSELTAQRFIANPFHDAQDPRSSERLYRTGDLVRYQADRTLEYLGRIDEQVKIRGFRIELGEIEAQLAAQDGVSSAVVLVQETQPGDKRLIGYVAGSACTGAELKSKLREVLPEYMVPTHIVVLEQLPLTTNGKVDRKALPEPSSEQQEAVYEAPVTSTEKLLASIWAELLQVDVQGIGAQANFFALGGHSLMVIRLMARLQEVGHAVEVRSVFAAPTLRALAQAIDAAEQEGRAQQAFQAPPNAIPAGCERLTPEMLPLVQLTQAQLDEIVGQVPGGAANVQDIYPLAPLQQGIHFHHSLHAEHDPYVLPALLEVDDEPALQALLSALQQVIDRHDALRTAVLPLREHGAVQVVWRQALLPCQELALEAGEDALQQMQRRLEAPQRMVLTQAPLLHAELARDPAGTRCFVLLRLHHIVSDHLGLERVHAEVQACLEGRAQQLPAPLPYREFVAHAQHQARSGDAEEFFRERLADVDEPTAPYGLLDVHGDGRGVVERRRSLDEGLARRIRETARLQRVGPATLFHAAWALVVSATSGRDDVVFGTVLSGRLQGTRGAEHTLGLFINTLPLRLRLRGQSAQGLLRQTEEALTGLLAHEQTPLALAQRCSALPSGTPLFTAMLNYRHDAHLQSSAIEPAATACFRLLRMQERTNYPFNLAVDDFDAGFELMAQVDKSLDAPALLDHMLRALEHLTHALEQNPDSAVLKLDLLPLAERQALLLDLNRTHSPYPDHSSVHACFEAQVARTPERTAVEDAKSALSYGELDVRAQMLASVLAAHGVRRGDRVGLCVERGVDMVSGLLGILKAGAAYLPLDPAYPPARLAHMVHDSAMPVLLTQRSLRDQVEALTAGHPGLRIVCLEDCEAPVTGARPDAVGPDDLLYVNYTSGSTGQPKGVEILHRGAVNLAQAQSRLFEVKSGSRVLAFASIGFDAAASEWLMSLLVGATLVICGETERHAPAALEDFLIEHRVTHATIPPAMLTHMRPDRPYVLRCLVLAGEAFSRELVQAWTQRCAVFNAYGPTEVTVCASATRLHAGEEITLGAPIANTRLHVLDAQGRLVPRGVAGELYVEGVGLARGYLGRPQLSAERFVVNPFHDPEDPGSGARLYRTGDRVRRRADGALLFLGRADDQIKLQGVRIELGEIERQLAQDPRVATAAVLLREDRPGHKRLVAYLVPQVETAIEVQAVRARLREVLPDTMVPAAFVVLDALPLNRSGKVDRRALPAPALTADAALAETPVSPTEQLLADLWTVLLELGNEPVGRSSSFFALGGDSLKVVQLAAEVRERLGVELSLKAVFAEPTLMGVAAQIDGLREQSAEQLADEARRAALLGAPGLAQAGKKKRQVMA